MKKSELEPTDLQLIKGGVVIGTYTIDETAPGFSSDCIQIFEEGSSFTAPFSNAEIHLGYIQDVGEVVLKQSLFSNGVLHEWNGLIKLLSHDLPVQKPVLIGVNRRTGNQIMVTRKINGSILRKINDDSIRQTLGHVVKNMHVSVPVGEGYWERFGLGRFETYDRRILSWDKLGISELKKGSIARNLLEQSYLSMISYLESVEIGFVHRDLHDDQVIVSEGNIPTLLDFEYWSEGDVLREVALYLFHNRKNDQSFSSFKAFTEGVLGRESLQGMEFEIVRFYLIYISCIAIAQFTKVKTQYLPYAFQNLQKAIEILAAENLF